MSILLPFIPGNPRHTAGPNGTITRIVIHGTVSPCEKGGARNVARYFQTPTAGGLAHFVADPFEIVQCAREDVATWHAPPNVGSIGIELCDPQEGSSERWFDPDHRAMLRLAASLVADLCRRHDLPRKYVDSAGLLIGHTGITEHADVSHAFGQSTHTDPGDGFPMAVFIDMVNAAAKLAKPPTAPPSEVAMPVLIRRKGGKGVHVTDWIHRRGIATNAELNTITGSGVPAHIYEVTQDVFDRLKEAK